MVAPAATGHTAPPIPHIAVPAEAPVEEQSAPLVPKKRPALKKNVMLAGVAALLVLGVGGYFAWTTLISPPPPPPPPVVVKPKPVVVAPVADAATPTAPVTSSAATKAAAPLTPSDTMNALAQAPVNAINKAQDAVAVRAASGQSRVDALAGQEGPERPAVDRSTAGNAGAVSNAKGAVMANKPAATASATLAPGVSATSSEVAAVAEASPAFRTFVANVKITGVIQGTPAKIILNSRLARAGDVVDSALGVVFASIDSEKKQLVFKDKSGAVVTRKY